ncbi:S-adenosyl-L-methionine-dependent methyltransferase [Dactylonectria macrodidyma]|uniref:S-adenosyl-L-methionine-dependent methyltransferase n=1 Tax=Dactylonectria macrodidyma TaxID=307937 RepID=A0A9P9EIN6_9HYPO|nr:S-adenosyl-L-methionine-dependent methyltransferase [Dactylonectria macrodidyma]
MSLKTYVIDGERGRLLTESKENDDTASLSPSCLERFRENGYCYKKDDLLPDDEVEKERQDLVHHIYLLAHNQSLYQAPIDRLNQVLDVGTGTGIWAINFADRHPGAKVVGVDWIPRQPYWVPPNLEFEVDDLEKPWTWPAETFDYIHLREPVFKNMAHITQQMYKHTKPGGYVELQASMLPVCSDDSDEIKSLRKWLTELRDGSEKLGRPYQTEDGCRRLLEDAGFEGIVSGRKEVPIGPRAQDPALEELGEYATVAFDHFLEHVSMATLTRAFGMSEQEVIVFLAKVRAECRANSSYYTIFYVYGSKPEGPGAGGN